MPYKAKHECNEPGCRTLTTARLCPLHQAQNEKQYEAARGTAAERGYTATWSRLRRMKLADSPLCQRCGRAATLVHHRDRDTGNSSEDNLESLCSACHRCEHKEERWRGSQSYQKGPAKPGWQASVRFSGAG